MGFRHRAALGLLEVDHRLPAGSVDQGFVGFRPVSRVCPDRAGEGVGIKQVCQLCPVMGGSSRDGPAPDQPVPAIDIDVVLVAKGGDHQPLSSALGRRIHLVAARLGFPPAPFDRPAGIGVFLPILGLRPIRSFAGLDLGFLPIRQSLFRCL